MPDTWTPTVASPPSSFPALDGDGAGPLGRIAQRLRDNSGVGHGSATSSRDVDELVERLLAYAAQAERQLAAQRERIAQLETVSMTDELTGIANRRGFADYLRRTLHAASRHTEHGVVAFIDIDDFKHVNDTYGHAAGDAALVHVAEVLTTSTRLSDFVARLHGDEFAVLLVRADTDQALARLRTIQRRLATEPLIWREQEIPIQVSFGLAAYGPETEPASLMQKVDVEMYRQKRARRDDRIRGRRERTFPAIVDISSSTAHAAM
ncbi:MAG: GGDEF domain-containing protein [Deltaproteobacteria bacterium]|nr:GGDEF domain-containing protein [Deltaproteobacteria bacterium]